MTVERPQKLASTIGTVLLLASLFALVTPASADRDPRIVGGTETTIAEWPWQVALAVNDEIDPRDGFQRQFCGGTLVAPTVVITAAHCLFDSRGPGTRFNTSPNNFEVFAGRTTLSSSQGQAIDFANFFFPVVGGGNAPAGTATPLYDPSQDEDHDFVVVQLESQASAGIPIKVAGATEEPTWAAGQPAFITGWGDQQSGAGNFPDNLREGRVQVIADSTCNAAYTAALFHASTMVCAGLPGGGVDTCQGDSGGPLVVPISGGGFRLVGDSSFGVGCALAQFPGVYGRLADNEVRGLIEQITQQRFGISVLGSGAAPLTLPDTLITKKPKNRLKVKRRKQRARATYKFTASEPGSTFACQLDQKAPVPCASPFSKKVKRGRHKVAIVATNFIGDPGPAVSDSFRVKRKRR